MRAVEVPYARAVEEEKNRFVYEVATTYASQQRILDQQADHHSVAMIGIAERYQGIAIRLAIKQALWKAAEKSYQQREDWEKLWLYLVRMWVEQWGAQRARQAAGTTRKDIQTAINAGLAVDSNPVQVATAILKARELSAPRADLIARTETHNAMMFAGEEGAAQLQRQSGIELKKRWVPVLDERTRINHAVMASVDPIPLHADFLVGGERMSRPGDPRASGGNVIHCRCVLAYEPVTD